METVGKAKRAWFARVLDLAHGIPSHDTFGRVFAVLSPEAWQACFLRWIGGGLKPLSLTDGCVSGQK